MKISKHTITITVEVLDPLAAMSQIMVAARAIDNETPEGNVATFDGDCVNWTTDIKQAEV